MKRLLSGAYGSKRLIRLIALRFEVVSGSLNWGHVNGS
jgi:hypothetical protein